MSGEITTDTVGASGDSLERFSDRIAEWHEEPPPDPDLLRRIRRLRWERVGVVVFCLAIVSAVILLGALTKINVGSISYPFIMLVSAVTAKAWFRRAPPSVSHMIDLPPVVPQFPVYVEFFVNGVKTGSDHGMVTFMAGWLTLQGTQTEFSVPPPPLGAYQMGWAGAKKRKNQSRTCLSILHIGYGEMAVGQIRIYAFDVIDGLGNGFQAKFRRAAEEWPYQKGAEPGQVVLPPASPHPAVVRAAKGYRLTWIALLAASLTAAVAGIVELSGFFAFELLLSALFFAMVLEGRKRLRVLASLQNFEATRQSEVGLNMQPLSETEPRVINAQL